MRLRFYLSLPLLLAATPLGAQDGPPPAATPVLAEAAPALPLRLGLKPLPPPFPFEAPAVPGRDAYWLRLRFVDWVGQWDRELRGRLEGRRAAAWRETRLGAGVAADSVPYLPPVPQQVARRAGLLPGLVGDYADLGIQINGRGELGGSWTRFRPCDPGFHFNCNPSLFPQLRPDIQFGVLVGGTISERIHVNVDYDQRREFDAANNINVYYQGLEDEVVQRLEVGDVSIRLPQSRYLTQGIPAGNFGLKATGQLGPLDFQAVWAQQKGDVSTREFRLGGTRGPEGLVQDAQLVLDDADYAKGQFFFLVEPERLLDYPHLDVLALTAAAAPPAVRPGPGASIQVYRDERISAINQQQRAQLGYFLAEASTPDRGLRHSGFFRRLIQGEDYLVHSSGLWLVLRSPLREEEALAIAYVTEAGDTVGTFNAEQSAAPRLRLLRGPTTIHQPGQATWKYEMHQVYRLDSSNSVELGSVELRISLGELVGGVTFKEAAGQQVQLLRLLGLDEDAPVDQLDRAQIYQPARSSFGEVQQSARIGGTYIVFPTIEPFKRPPPVPSLRLTAEQTRAALGTDSNAAIYDNPDPVARQGSSRYRLNFSYRVRLEGLISSFNLGAFGIREESEKITVDGVLLRRGSDYTIDYDIGVVTLSDPELIFGKNPEAEIKATWEQKALFQIAPTSVFGLNTRYQLGSRGELNFLGLYQSEKTLMARPQLGIEPSAIFLGGASGRLDLGAGWLDRVLDRVPGLHLGSASAINLSGEAALSLPNPNTRGDAYLDDFESSDEIPLALERQFWRLGSRPSEPERSDGVLPLPLDIQNAGRLVWQHDFLDSEGRTRGPLFAQEIDRQINIAGARLPESVLYISFGDAAGGAPRSQWRSVVTVLSTTGRDMTRSEFLEFYVFAPEGVRDLALVLDLGAVGEDAFYFDQDRRTSGSYADGTRWGAGVLDEEARLSKREIWGKEQDARGLWDQPCQGRLGTTYPLGDPTANCTRENGRPDTEDLDGNGVPDLEDGPFFRYIVRLDRPSPYLVRDREGTGTAFRLYRIPLRGAALPMNGANEGTWRFIKHLRLTLAGAPTAATPVVLGRMRILGSRWTKREVHGILRGQVGDSPGSGASTTTFQVGPVSRLSDGADYSSPPGVREQLQDPTSQFGAGAVEFNEKALRLAYGRLEPGERAEVYFRYPQQPRNFLGYRQLRLWAVPRRGQYGTQGDQWLVVKIATDARNAYLYRTRLHEAPAGGAVRQADWLPEVLLDFEQWFELKARAEQDLIAAGGKRPTGEPLVLWSADSAYAVVLEDRARAPNLAAVRELAFAVYNGGSAAAAGEVWLNDMRLAGAVTDAGFAGHLNLDVRAADFLTANLSLASQGALFRQLNQDVSYQTAGDLNLSTTAQLGQLLPSAWGVELPVSFAYTRSGLEPAFLQQSDVRADRLAGLRETGAERTRVGVSLRKRTPTASPWLGLVLDGTALRLGYNTASTTSIAAAGEARGLDAGLSYSRQISARELDITPGFLDGLLRWILPASFERSELFRRLSGAKLRWSPDNLSFSTTFYDQASRSYRYETILDLPGAPAVKPTESPRRGLENNASIAFRPFESLSADLSLTSSRDLLAPEQASQRAVEQQAMAAARSRLAGLDLGWETDRSMSSQLSFRPAVAAWLRPGFTYSARFRTERNPSYLELLVQGEDTAATLQRGFQADKQVMRTLLVEPAGLLKSLLGPPGAGSWLRRGLLSAGQALQPVDLAWNHAINSRFERETAAPGLGYQFGFGDLEAFRLEGSDTASSARATSGFRLRSGLRLPGRTELSLGYEETESEFLDLRGGRNLQQETVWPDLQLSWNQIPLPSGLRPVIANASLSAGYRARDRAEQLGGDEGRPRGSEESSIPLRLTLGFGRGISVAYTGTFTEGGGNDPTGNTEQDAANHSLQLSGSLLLPGKWREKLKSPIQVALRYNQQGREQCRIPQQAEEGAACVPFADDVNRSFDLTLDTVLSDLQVGLQMSYIDRQSNVGTRSGSSQFQLGLFGQFRFQAGSMPRGMR